MMRTSLLMMMKRQITSRFMIYWVIMLSLIFVASVSKAQFALRTTKDGPYEIKMIAAPNLQPVYLNAAKATSSVLQADSIIPSSTIRMSGNLMEINNRYKDGSPFVEMAIPLPAILCKNPEAPCMLGLEANTPNSSCPERYTSTPPTVTKYISMSYADYDGDNSTFASSMAQLDIPSCAEIEEAYLYWAGNFRGSNPAITLQSPTIGTVGSYNGNADVFNVGNNADIRTVRLKRPGGAYQNVTATTTYTSTETYVCVANVTNQLQGTGGGQFWVGNIRSYPNEGNGGSTSGWTLVVIFRSPLSPPRLINVWDGFRNIEKGQSETFTLNGLQAPSTAAGFQSFIGFAALDGENLATQSDVIGQQEGLGFQTNMGGTAVSINPYQTDQPTYKLWTKKGFPATCSGADNKSSSCNVPQYDANWCSVYDGVSSSHISTYDAVKGTNGNELVRLPSMVNTLGYDSHHMKLPNGAVAPNATQATLTVKAGPQGSTMPFMAYVAIERLQPKLELAKASNVDVTETNKIINYTLTIKNTGNAPSLGSAGTPDIIRDTLDAATTYVAASLGSTPAGYATLASSNTVGGRQILVINVPRSVAVGDSVKITFNVQVKAYNDDPSLWNPPTCKRTITNTAWIAYNTLNSGILINKSNANDCGIGSETRVMIQDALFAQNTTKDSVVNINICPIRANGPLVEVRKALTTSGKISAANISLYDIRDQYYNRITTTDTFLVAPLVTYYAIRDAASGSNCQEIYKVTYKDCILPLDMLAFTGQWTPSAIRLYWSVTSGKPHEYFVVERSANGRSYYPIGTVHGSLSKNYSFADIHTGEGSFYYYRIVLVNEQGNRDYSKAIMIHKNNNTDMSIFPNPSSTGSATLLIKDETELPFELNIFDLAGKLVHSSTGHTTNTSVTIGHDLLAGVYLIEACFDEYKLKSKFVKTH